MTTKTYARTCRFPPCGKQFETDNPHSRYCCERHRQDHYLRIGAHDVARVGKVHMAGGGIFEDRFWAGR